MTEKIISVMKNTFSEIMSRILLEGNIAAGKTTLLKKIAKLDFLKNGKRVEVVAEPVKIWTNTPVGNLLTAANNKEISQVLFQVKFVKMDLHNLEILNYINVNSKLQI
jgi:accessory colonization factor AcfC